MKIAIVGYGMEGVASYAYFAGKGHEVTICDQNVQLEAPAGAQTQLGEAYLDDLDRFDMIVRTAGMHPKIILDKNPSVVSKVTTQLNEFMRACPTKNTIAITGTKGKGTTTTLTAKILEAAGKKVFVGGNIGIPLFSFIDQVSPDDWVVLELSSFQLMDVQFSPHIAVCVMVVSEHLDWHADMAEYLQAKSNLFAKQTSSDIAIYFGENENSKHIASAGDGQKLPYYALPGATIDNRYIVIDNNQVCATDELKLLGKHNWQNACAAVTTAWQVTQDIAAMRSVLTTFTGLEHRLEFVREFDGVKYYDDSFGTTPETAIVAMQAFEQPKIVILGGSDKGAGYDELAQAVVANHVRQVVLIGEQAARIQAALETAGFADFSAGGNTMVEILDHARAAAQAGDIILLSTGCASFDMFQNYKDRGDQFKQAVLGL